MLIIAYGGRFDVIELVIDDHTHSVKPHCPGGARSCLSSDWLRGGHMRFHLAPAGTEASCGESGDV